MKPRLKQQQARYTASRRLQAPDPIDLVWKQWGQAIVTQYPREEWQVRLLQVPKIYRAEIRNRLIREHGDKVIAS